MKEISSLRRTKRRASFSPRHCEAHSAVAIQCARKGASRPLEKPLAFALAMTKKDWAVNDKTGGKRTSFPSLSSTSAPGK
jgi:hypothetical protein